MAMTNVYTGANGILVFMAAGTATETADADALLGDQMYNLFDVGRVTDVEVCVKTELSEYHEIGRRHATSLHPGNIHVSGKVGRAYINGALLFLLLGRGANPNNIDEPYVQPTLQMQVVLQDPAVPETRSVVTIENVKFENWSFALPEDDFVMENVTFKALRIRVQDEEAPSPGGERAVKTPQFPEAG
ncbi:MAG TPA: hypothetical protein VG148_10410 [Pyrinomonadaceae bacterium]|nr:hypothetical protein [Pyrinomonadaceae bacterium]